MGVEPEDRAARFGARAALAGLGLALVAIPFGLLLLLVRGRWAPLQRVDEGARDGLNAFARDHDGFVTAMQAISTAGSSTVYWVLFGAIALVLVGRRRRRAAAFVVVTLVGNGLLNAAVKHAVDRARPVLAEPVATAGGLSFPSGHAQGAVVAAGVVVLLALPGLGPRARAAAVGAGVVFALAVGFSRVALGVHFVSDVLAGFVLGAAWLALLTAAFSVWRREHGRVGVELSGGLEPEPAQTGR